MIKSMTGFGRTEVEVADKKIFIDIKSLNSKQLDLNLKLPWLYKEKEAEIRNIVGKYLCRGKVEVNIYSDSANSSGDTAYKINKNIVSDYYNQLRDITLDLNLDPIKSENILGVIMRLPEVLKSEQRELSDEEWNIVKEKLIEALKSVDNYRFEEGKAIDSDFQRAVSTILNYLDEVIALDGERIKRIRQRLEDGLEEFLPQEKIDKNRFEQELIFYIEKIDINEEKVRLRKHCEYFLEKMGETEPNGKILNFISQEMGREINTLGSKANDADIQKLVINMKDELEKIKEQTLNVL